MFLAVLAVCRAGRAENRLRAGEKSPNLRGMDDYLEMLRYLRADRKTRSYQAIARDTGVPASTLRSILAYSKDQTPRVGTVAVLLRYYRARQTEAA